MTTTSNISRTVNDIIGTILPELITIRHDLHKHPELGYNETRTSGVIQDFLTKIEVPFEAGLAKGTGVLGHLEGNGDNSIALRADIDALPITEENEFDWKSIHEGCMHACGHDGHTTILLGAAKVLSTIAKEQELPNPVTFVFQPAEEGGGGGEQMVLDGCLDGSRIGKPVGMMFGLHGWPQQKLNDVATKVGPMLAADIGVNVTIRGVGGHAAFPHLCCDPILCASQLVLALQQLASRNTDPLDALVVSITQFNGGSAHNIIPEEVKLVGTMRYLEQETGEMAKKRFVEIVNGVATAHGCEASITLHDGYPVTRNDEKAVETFFEIANETLLEDQVLLFEKPVMGGEDFSYYCKEVPSCFFALGLLPQDKESMPSLHQPTFDFNDDAIKTGITMFCALALQTKLN
ncbi:MAG: amidohydrolase [Phycisphaerales bacterium]|nr:amidohydrolase [Planctomycetota bacterium]MBL6997185.1 amidohydrolase [Phycisphaerales bacterium]